MSRSTRSRWAPESISAAMRSASRPSSRPTSSIVSRESCGWARKRASWYSQNSALGAPPPRWPRPPAAPAGDARGSAGDGRRRRGGRRAARARGAAPTGRRGKRGTGSRRTSPAPAAGQLATEMVALVERGSKRVVHSAGCYASHEPHRVDPGPDAGGDAAGAASPTSARCRRRSCSSLGGLAIAFLPGLPTDRARPRHDLPRLPAAPGLLRRLAHLAAGAAHGDAAAGLLAVGLVFLTAAVVAVVAHATVPGLGWAEAAVLGAILAPTDAVAAIAVFRRIGGPERVRLLVEGESMINDGTALVLYSIALGVATGGAFSLGDAALEFVAVSARRHRRRARRRLPLDPRDPPPGRHQPGRRPHRADRLRRLHRGRGARRLRHPRRRRRRPLRRLPGAARASTPTPGSARSPSGTSSSSPSR